MKCRVCGEECPKWEHPDIQPICERCFSNARHLVEKVLNEKQEESVRRCYCGKTENLLVCDECVDIVKEMCRRDPIFKEEVRSLIAMWKRNYQLMTKLEQKEAIEEVERMLNIEDSGT